MKLSTGVRDLSDQRLRYARQLGADGVSLGANSLPSYNRTRRVAVDELAAAKATLSSYDLAFLTIRLHPSDTHDILTDGPNRDQEIENICMSIRAAGEVGVPFLYYNLTPWRSLPNPWAEMPGAPGPEGDEVRVGSGPGRRYRPTGRGGTVLLTHRSEIAATDIDAAPEASVAPYGRISADEMWERIEYMYERVIPAAEEAGVNVGAHPNDPPEPVYRGVEQNLNSVAGLKRLVDTVDSPRSGLLLCIGTLHEMGEDTFAALDYFLGRGKIFYAHFRNPSGTIPSGFYQEDFLDEGDLDMLEVLRLFKKHGYEGGFDPDHAVGVVGDEDGRIGFGWEIGYMRALLNVVAKEG